MNAKVKTILLKVLSIFGRDNGGKIMFYHDIHKNTPYVASSTSVEVFVRHMEKAKALGYSVVHDVPFEDKTFQICFDDGYRGVLECRDVFEHFGICPTIYLPIAHIGKQNYLRKEEILELSCKGYRFESHTWNHVWLPECSTSELRHELGDSRKWLSDFLGKEISQICFPRGLFSEKVLEEAKSAGYRDLVSCVPGSTRDKVGFNLLPRNLVQSLSDVEFGYVLLGALRPLRRHYINMHFMKHKTWNRFS